MPRLTDPRPDVRAAILAGVLNTRRIVDLYGTSWRTVCRIRHELGLAQSRTSQKQRDAGIAPRECGFSRVDELILTGEPDRRALCYRCFANGGTDADAIMLTGSTRAEVQWFRREMPADFYKGD